MEVNKAGEVHWKTDPRVFLDDHFDTVVGDFKSAVALLDYDPQKVEALRRTEWRRSPTRWLSGPGSDEPWRHHFGHRDRSPCGLQTCAWHSCVGPSSILRHDRAWASSMTDQTITGSRPVWRTCRLGSGCLACCRRPCRSLRSPRTDLTLARSPSRTSTAHWASDCSTAPTRPPCRFSPRPPLAVRRGPSRVPSCRRGVTDPDGRSARPDGRGLVQCG